MLTVFGFRKIAWSRQGGIAFITSDGLRVKHQCLKLHQSTGTWDLSLPTTIAQIREHDLQNHYSHLEWGPSGSDLAILDSKSRLAIWSITMAATNKLTESRSATEDPRDDLNLPVGVFWLNPDRPVGPASSVADCANQVIAQHFPPRFQRQ
jgi:mediator of RNA polymerase II transcription subunit 16, fungi type